MIDLNLIIKEGTFIDGGRHRDVFKYKNTIYKIAEKFPRINAKEYTTYILNKNNKFFNPILDINKDSTILEVEECIPLPDFIIKVNNYENDEKYYRFIKYDLVQSDKDTIFTIAKKYKLDKYIYFTEKELYDLSKKYRLDYEELIYPLNWGYNKKLKKLVILDYAD